MSNLPKFTPEGSYDPNDNKEYCSKSLYEQLQEQKNLKLKKFEEENSFKNAIKMYDEDDLAFVNEVRQSVMLKELEKANEVKALVKLAKKKEADRLSNSVNVYEKVEEKLQSMRKSNFESDKINLLKSILKRKRSEDACQSENKTLKLDLTDSEANIFNGNLVFFNASFQIFTMIFLCVFFTLDNFYKDVGENFWHDNCHKKKPVEISAQQEQQGITGLPGMDAYASDNEDDKSNSDSSDSSSSSDIDVGTLRPLIKRLNEKIKKNC